MMLESMPTDGMTKRVGIISPGGDAEEVRSVTTQPFVAFAKIQGQRRCSVAQVSRKSGVAPADGGKKLTKDSDDAKSKFESVETHGRTSGQG